MRKITTFYLFFALNTLFAQELTKEQAEQRLPEGITRPTPKRLEVQPQQEVKKAIYPDCWWIGMEQNIVEVMLHGKNIANMDFEVNAQKKNSQKSTGVVVEKVEKTENPNYLFVTLNIQANCQPETVLNLICTDSEEQKMVFDFPIHARKKDKNRIQGLSNADLVYLIMPDRFANGDYNNDSFDDLNQRGTDRRRMFYRHGGDLQGIIDHLDYLQDLGATALWLNPIQENNQFYESYHGYAFTNHYAIDKRFGTSEKYQELIDKCHAKGIKMVMDLVHNHVGDQHFFILDLPSEDWVNQWDTFTRTTYRDQTVFDPYVSQYDQNQMLNGWFDVQMPDLNQRNPHVAKYLIQNNIWWIEKYGIDAFRLDTYLYNDQAFMAEWGKILQREYPQLAIFAETWVHGIVNQAQTTQNNFLRKDYNSYLPAVTDFQLYYSINEALNQRQGWTEGVTKMYQNLSNDFIYENPYRNVTFLDNHDLGRFFSVVGEDMNKFKSGIAWLMTMRGIPQLYYGTELAMTGFTDPDGKVRQDMEGGWKGDAKDKFKEKDRTEIEKEAFSYVRKLAQWRKQTPAVQSGRLKQFLPQDGIYIYARYDRDKTIVVVMNTNNDPQTLDLTKRYKEILGTSEKAKNIATDGIIEDLKQVKIEKNSTLILELF